MRLLHTTSLLFEEFFDNNIPPYAILSHRWEGKEVGFHEFEAAKEQDGPEFSKIKNFCSFVRQQGLGGDLEWVWIDTCCIDKKSSAELSEAINSMFQWYKRSWACYAYLSSVDADARPWRVQEQQFRQSAWFTRGWTLQELIAPRQVYFLDRQWNIIGEKTQLAADISAITGIREYCLNLSEGRNIDIHSPHVSIAARMSWVSKRETSRLEDMAYCLLGIFDINMPLLYGEGKKAFMRLQLEIIRKSDDESVFAWTDPDRYLQGSFEYYGMLAAWPTWFANCGDFVAEVSSRPPYSMTNKGLEFHIPAYPASQKSINVALNCYRVTSGGARRVTIVLFNNGFGKISRHVSIVHRAGFEDYVVNQKQGSYSRVIYIPQEGI